MLCDNLGERNGGWAGREVQETGDMCIRMADSC